jgi:hypothetical protein
MPISVVISETPQTTITYSDTIICNNGPNSTATILGTSGGTFSASPAGLSINSSTGEITTTSSSPGLYTVTYSFSGGTTTKQIRIRPVYNISNTASICQGQSIFLAGANQTTAGVYTSNLQTIHGCDSIVVTTLTVNQPSSSSLSLTTCAGDSVQVGGQYISTAGQTTIVTTNAAGCDSTITLNLTLNQTYNTPVSQTICQGDSFIFNGVALTTAGTYVENNQTTLGCDSSTTLTLTVNQVNVAVTNVGFTLTSQASGANYQWLDCNSNYSIIQGATNQTFSPVISGDYAVQVTEQNCVDTSVCEFVAIQGIEENDRIQFTLYPNPSNGNLKISFTKEMEGTLSMINLTGSVIFKDYFKGAKEYTNHVKLEPGTYIIQIEGDGKVAQGLWVVK